MSNHRSAEKAILLVEDNQSDVALTERAFGKCQLNLALVVASDGQEALDYLFAAGAHAGRDVGDQPALVLLDLKLPRVDGLGVLRRMRADPRTHRVPVVIMTSSLEAQDLAAAYDEGVNSYLRKPVDFEQFARAIATLATYWLVLNQRAPSP
jgi:two-component system response regulator